MSEPAIITKTDAALRQLALAIRLFFSNEDMLAVHTLTGAAFQLLADLGKLRGIRSPVRTDAVIKPERLKEWVAALNSTQNFLMHADKDPDGTHKYVDEATTLFLFEAVELARALGHPVEQERLAFTVWFLMSYPDLVLPEVLKRLNGMKTEGLDQTDKALWAAWLARPNQRLKLTARVD